MKYINAIKSEDIQQLFHSIRENCDELIKKDEHRVDSIHALSFRSKRVFDSVKLSIDDIPKDTKFQTIKCDYGVKLSFFSNERLLTLTSDDYASLRLGKTITRPLVFVGENKNDLFGLKFDNPDKYLKLQKPIEKVPVNNFKEKDGIIYKMPEHGTIYSVQTSIPSEIYDKIAIKKYAVYDTESHDFYLDDVFVKSDKFKDRYNYIIENGITRPIIVALTNNNKLLLRVDEEDGYELVDFIIAKAMGLPEIPAIIIYTGIRYDKEYKYRDCDSINPNEWQKLFEHFLINPRFTS